MGHESASDKLVSALQRFLAAAEPTALVTRLLERLRSGGLPWELRCVAGCLFFNHHLHLPARPKLADQLALRGVEALQVRALPRSDALLQLHAWWSRTGQAHAPAPLTDPLKIGSMDLQPPPGQPQTRENGRSSLVLALEDLARLRHQGGSLDPSWGLRTVLRLEAAVRAEGRTFACLELGEHPASPATRVARLSCTVLATLRGLGVASWVLRATGHAALLVGLHGLGRASLAEAAAEARSAVFSALGAATSHHLRCVALLDALAEGSNLPRVVGLIELAWELEARRCPKRTLLFELLELSRQRGPRDAWIVAVFDALGPLPAGTAVRVPRVGTGFVFGTGSVRPYRPRVWVGGRFVVPQEPVHVLGGLAADQPQAE